MRFVHFLCIFCVFCVFFCAFFCAFSCAFFFSAFLFLCVSWLIVCWTGWWTPSTTGGGAACWVGHSNPPVVYVVLLPILESCLQHGQFWKEPLVLQVTSFFEHCRMSAADHREPGFPSLTTPPRVADSYAHLDRALWEHAGDQDQSGQDADLQQGRRPPSRVPAHCASWETVDSSSRCVAG